VAHVTTIDQALDFLLLNQLKAIQRAGYEVVGISSPGPHVGVVEAAGIRHLAVPMTRNYTPLADLLSLWRLYRAMRRERFAIVHTHNPKAGLLGQLAARLARVPVIVNTLHGFYLHERMHPLERRFYMTLERLAARCSTLILSQNAEDVETAVSEGVAPRGKIEYLGNGIDLSTFSPALVSDEELARRRAELGISSGAPVVGFVGRLAARRKGLLDFLRAGQIIAARVPDVRFLVIGEPDPGKADAVYPEAAGDYGLEGKCIFLGRVRSADLPVHYAMMSALVLPSLFEGVPRVVMEAAAMGVPSVVTDVKGNREAVTNGETGLLVSLGRPEELAAAILQIVGDPSVRARMGTAARHAALTGFDERRIFATILDDYARLLTERAITPPTTAAPSAS
jgi:glycosyltransferase involved in cell wall biosynthesis